jgi:hypothetical protein
MNHSLSGLCQERGGGEEEEEEEEEIEIEVEFSFITPIDTQAY